MGGLVLLLAILLSLLAVINLIAFRLYQAPRGDFGSWYKLDDGFKILLRNMDKGGVFDVHINTAILPFDSYAVENNHYIDNSSLKLQQFPTDIVYLLPGASTVGHLPLL